MKDIAGLLEKATKDLGLDSVILYGSKGDDVGICCKATSEDLYYFLTDFFNKGYLDFTKDIIKEYENQ